MEITPGAKDTTRFWYYFDDATSGGSKPTKVRIDFNYAQKQGSDLTSNRAESYLEYKESKDTNYDCPRGTFKMAKQLNVTWKDQLTCTSEFYELPIKRGVKAIYWQFRKKGFEHGPNPLALMIDDVKVTLVFGP